MSYMPVYRLELRDLCITALSNIERIITENVGIPYTIAGLTQLQFPKSIDHEIHQHQYRIYNIKQLCDIETAKNGIAYDDTFNLSVDDWCIIQKYV